MGQSVTDLECGYVSNRQTSRRGSVQCRVWKQSRAVDRQRQTDDDWRCGWCIKLWDITSLVSVLCVRNCLVLKFELIFGQACMHLSLITLHSACDYPSGGRCAAQIAQLDTPQASKESHNSIHNRRCVVWWTEPDELNLLGVQLEKVRCHPVCNISDAAQELGGWWWPIGRLAAGVELRVVSVWVNGDAVSLCNQRHIRSVQQEQLAAEDRPLWNAAHDRVESSSDTVKTDLTTLIVWTCCQRLELLA